MNEQRPRRVRPNFVGRTRRAGLILAAMLAGAGLLVPSVAGAQSAGAAAHVLTGHLDSATVRTNEVDLAGWAVDTTVLTGTARIAVSIGGPVGSAHASESPFLGLAHDSRPDVGKVFPAYGNHRGFTAQVFVPGGKQTLCVYTEPYAQGAQALLGCATVTVSANRPPIGHLDSVKATGNGHILISGWAADPNLPAKSITVQLYLGGDFAHAFSSLSVTANRSRPDVAAALPGYGAEHGFSVSVATKAGTYPVCAYAIDDFYAAPLNTKFPCLSITS